MDILQKFSTPIAIVVAGALVGGGLFFSGTAKSTAQPGATQPSVDIKKVKITADDPYIGKKDAPVTIAYWSDYQCPFCKAVEVGGIPQIPLEPSIPHIIKDDVETGKVKIVFKDFPFLGNDSLSAALYEHAVWEMYPDQFYAWREAMFKAQDEEGDKGFGNETSILKLTRTIPGFDADKLKALVASKKNAYTAAIQADMKQASDIGIQGTPAFIIGKKLISGADKIDTFTAAIETAQAESMRSFWDFFWHFW